MTTLRLNLSERVTQRLEALASESGFSTVEQYVETLLESEVAATDGPAALRVSDEDDLTKKIAEGLASGPAFKVKPEFWDDLRNGIGQRKNS